MMRQSLELLMQLQSMMKIIHAITADMTTLVQKYFKISKNLKKNQMNITGRALKTFERKKTQVVNMTIVTEGCEKICEEVQRFVTLAMTLPNINYHYGIMIATASASSAFGQGFLEGNVAQGYIKNVEEAMSLSLQVLRSVSDVLSADYHVNNALSSSSVEVSLNERQKEKLINSISNQQSSLTKTTNLMIDCAIHTSTIFSSIQKMIEAVDKNILEEIHRKVQREGGGSHDDEFAGYSDEDRAEAMRAKAQAAASNDSNESKPSSSSTDMIISSSNQNEEAEGNIENSNENSRGKEEMEKEEKSSEHSEKSEKKEEMDNELNDLRHRIHNLQLKLYKQNIQIFRSLNSEVCTLQVQVQSQVMDILEDSSAISSPTNDLENLLVSVKSVADIMHESSCVCL